ncbi:MAG: hypothetical protein IT432_03190 [Phycisphaerales bacterium]|nr:hypothetical protein [Phycisphaerales bacterium]
MAEEVDKGKMIKIAVAAVCLLVGGYLIAANQGWVPALWGNDQPKATPIKMTEQQKKDFEAEKKKIEEAPPEEVPGA